MHKKFNRREFLKMGTKSALAVIAITACGDLVALGANRKKKLGKITVGEDNFIIGLEELKEHVAVEFIYNGKKSILLYNDGEMKAFENICTHKGGPSRLKGNKLVCQWHGTVFDSITGEALKGPAPRGSRLTSITINEQDGKIYVGAQQRE